MIEISELFVLTIKFLATLAVAAFAGYLTSKIGVPVGWMIGAMFAVAVMNILTDWTYFPYLFKYAIQVVTGAMIASRVGKNEISGMRRIDLPIAIVVLGMMLLNITFAYLIVMFSDLDIATALFAVTPGGISDMAMISSELGANYAIVAILQVFRLFFLLSTMPPIFKSIAKKIKHNPEPVVINRTDDPLTDRSQLSTEDFKYGKKDIIRLAGLFLSAALGGLILHSLNIPAGFVIGSMSFGIVFSCIFGKSVYPKKIIPFQQILSGIFIGIGIDKEIVSSLEELIVPILVMMIGIVFFTFIIAFLLYKLTKLDLMTALLSSTPGGITEMSILSEEFGADTPKIAMIQTARLIAVIALFPQMIKFILALVK